MKERKKLFHRLWDLPYGSSTPYQLFDASKNSKELVQKFQLQRKIPVHNGCVNSICWNENGRYLLSGSDDQHLSIVQGYDYSVLAYIRTGHRANIFSAKFLPCSGDSHVISSSGDGIIIYSDLEKPDTSMNNKFTCHKGTAYEIMTVPSDPNTFLSCGEDRTVRWFDIRNKTSCDLEDCKDDVLISCRSPVTSIAVNPLIPYQLAVGCADSSVQIFDRRMLSTQATAGCLSNGFRALMSYFTVPDFPQSRRITSLCYSADGREMLVSYSSDYIYLFDIKDDMGKRPKILSASDSGSYARTRPLMKRLRVRGDWSDTGPNSRPETEIGGNRDNSPNNLVRRMTDILTRMLFSSSQPRPESSPASSSSEPSPLASSHSEEGEMEAAIHPNNDEAATSGQPSEVDNESGNLQAPEQNEGSSTDTTQNVQSEIDTAANNCAFEEKNAEPQSSGVSVEPVAPKEYAICLGSPVYLHGSEESTLGQPGPLAVSGIAVEVGDTVHKTKQRNRESQSSSSLDEPSTSGYTTSSCSSVIKNSVAPSEESKSVEPVLLNSGSQVEGENVSEREELSESSDSADAHVCSTTKQQSNENVNTNSSVISYSEEGSEVPTSTQASDASNGPMERSSESETDRAVQSIQPNENLPSGPDWRLGPRTPPLPGPRTPSPALDEAEENAEEEVELMMEVDSWDSDSDDGSQPRSSQSNRTNRRRGRVSSSCDELDFDPKDEVKKDKPPKNVNRPKVKKMFTGHRNARTMIKESTFWGDNFVMSGSDCGHIFIWDRHTTELVMIMEADHHVVNCLQPHPFDPILASSGIDYDIKIWAPLKEEPFFDVEKANEIVKRNEIMLEVTKDTITVPASFMFNMFNTLNHLRNGHRQLHRWSRARAGRSAESSNR